MGLHGKSTHKDRKAKRAARKDAKLGPQTGDVGYILKPGANMTQVAYDRMASANQTAAESDANNPTKEERRKKKKRGRNKGGSIGGSTARSAKRANKNSLKSSRSGGGSGNCSSAGCGAYR